MNDFYLDEYFIMDEGTDECLGKIEAINKREALEIASMIYPDHPMMYAMTRNAFFC